MQRPRVESKYTDCQEEINQSGWSTGRGVGLQMQPRGKQSDSCRAL